MSEETTTDQTPVTPESQAPAEPTTVDELPLWAQQKISDANAEAAKYRTQKREAVENAKVQLKDEYEAQLAEATTKVADAEAALASKELERLKLETAVKAEIPTNKVLEFAKLLQGADEAELASHAEEVKRLLGTDTQSATDPSQGSGNHLPLNGDPLLAAVQAAIR